MFSPSGLLYIAVNASASTAALIAAEAMGWGFALPDGAPAVGASVAQVMAAHQSGQIDLHVPFQIKEVSGNGRIERVVLFHSEDDAREVELEVDAVLLQLGFKTALGPLKEWPLEVIKGAIAVDPVMKTSMDGVWAAGDITTFDGKL